MISAGKIILAALVSAIPIIVGLAFYCMTEFGFVYRFASLDNSIIMLWALMNGDELQNIYYVTKSVSFLSAFVFCYAWIWFGNNYITPFFLAVNEDGYIEQKRHLRYNWLENSLDDPGNKNLMIEDGSEDEDAPEQTMDTFLKSMRDTQFIQLEIMQSNLNNKRKAICIQDIIQLENQRA